MDSEELSLKLWDHFLFTKIFRTFRIAIQPGKLTIAFSAIALICAAGWVMDFTNTVVVLKDTQGRIVSTELQIYMTNPDMLQPYIESYKEKGARIGVFSTVWHFAAQRFHGTLNSLFAFNLPDVAANITDYFKALGWAMKYHPFYSIIFAVIKLAVIALAGGSICRIAALQSARGEKPGLSEALRFGTKKFKSFFTAPLVPLAICTCMGLLIFLLGLIANIPRVGELIMAIFMFFALLAGALVTIVLIGTIAGFNLMFPAIAYDGSDCFDAVSRSFNYVYSRPWRMAFYTATAAVYGAICYTFVRFFAFLLLWVTRWSLQLAIFTENGSRVNKLDAIWPQPSFMNLPGPAPLPTANWTEDIAAFLVSLCVLIVTGLVVSFVISFYFSANTIIYAALRNRVDDTPLQDVYKHPEQPDLPKDTRIDTPDNDKTDPAEKKKPKIPEDKAPSEQ